MHTKLICRHSCFADNFRYLSLSMNSVYLNVKNIYFIPYEKSKNYIEYSIPIIIIIYSEMRDENIVWNVLFAYDDIVNFIDFYASINIVPCCL